MSLVLALISFLMLCLSFYQSAADVLFSTAIFLNVLSMFVDAGTPTSTHVASLFQLFSEITNRYTRPFLVTVQSNCKFVPMIRFNLFCPCDAVIFYMIFPRTRLLTFPSLIVIATIVCHYGSFPFLQ